MKEIWKDDAGTIKEMHLPPDTGTLNVETWSFFSNNPAEGDLVITYNPKTKTFMDIPNVDQSQAEQWVREVEEKFAKDGTFITPWNNPVPEAEAETQTKVQQPAHPPVETFNKTLQPKPDSNPQEPKKTNQPSLDPNRPDPSPADALNPPKTTNNEPKKEEPKKEEPRKEEPPKTHKTSTGESGGNNELSTSFTAPGYQVENKAEFGLNRVTFTTPNGKITVNIPADWQPGGLATGSLWFDPSGQNDKEREKSARELEKYSVEIPHVKMSAPERPLPRNLRLVEMGWKESWAKDQATANLNSLGIRYNDNIVARTGLPPVLQPPPPQTNFSVPTGGQQGSFITFTGLFDGKQSATDATKIGGEPVPTIAESQHSRIVWNTSKSLIPTIEIIENGQTGRCPFHNVSVTMSTNAPIHLLRGQTANVTVTFSGLGALNQDVPYALINHSPNVIHMTAGGEAQMRMIPASKIVDPNGAQRGTYTDTVSITGWSPGAFTITATVRWKETCNLPLNAMHKQ